MIDLLTVKNYRGIREIAIHNLQRINVFVGRNNSGKTTILESVFVILSAGNPASLLNLNTFRGIGFDYGDILGLNFYKNNPNHSIVIEAEFSSPYQKRTLKFSKARWNEWHNNISDIMKKDNKDILSNNIGSEDMSVLKIEYDRRMIKNGSVENHISFLRILNDTIELKISREYKEELKGVFVLSKPAKSDVLHWLSQAKIKKTFDDVLNTLQEVDDRITNLEIGADGNIYADIGIEKMIPLAVLGDGIYRIMYILSVISQSANGFVIIDEIENGIHYSGLKSMWKAINSLSKKLKVQVFVSTHSIDCIKAMVDCLQDYGREISLYRTHSKGGDLKLIKYEFDILKDAVENDVEMR